ncbi:unnamed protein product [Caenorhabditis bovis]|uniref:Phospholipase A2 n=1 Tax=Caenorhabditis bovis TaxID=2654633 RepID=A0A8S1F2D6_9PELO|nr:unnamed protein product [Caenorhabditis bovis]
MLIFAIFAASLLGVGIAGQCNVLYQLDDMSYCKIGRSFEVYQFYGCSCSGIMPTKPIDGIDQCCESHNKCYNELVTNGDCANHNAPFYCLYNWNCQDRTVACNNKIKCLQSTCRCDEVFINCLSKYPYPSVVHKCQYHELAINTTITQ